MTAVYCALVHYPVKNREGATVTTAVTNLDVHDIARSAKTYGLKRYFVVTPIEAQRTLVHEIVDHWTQGQGQTRIPERGDALSIISIVDSIETAVAMIESEAGTPELCATAARSLAHPRQVTFEAHQRHIRANARPTLLLFGTGHGLADEVIERADHLLEPIDSGTGYNHLSVRAAAAIVFDRLLGRLA